MSEKDIKLLSVKNLCFHAKKSCVSGECFRLQRRMCQNDMTSLFLRGRGKPKSLMKREKGGGFSSILCKGLPSNDIFFCRGGGRCSAKKR